MLPFFTLTIYFPASIILYLRNSICFFGNKAVRATYYSYEEAVNYLPILKRNWEREKETKTLLMAKAKVLRIYFIFVLIRGVNFNFAVFPTA